MIPRDALSGALNTLAAAPSPLLDEAKAALPRDLDEAIASLDANPTLGALLGLFDPVTTPAPTLGLFYLLAATLLRAGGVAMRDRAMKDAIDRDVPIGVVAGNLVADRDLVVEGRLLVLGDLRIRGRLADVARSMIVVGGELSAPGGIDCEGVVVAGGKVTAPVVRIAGDAGSLQAFDGIEARLLVQSGKDGGRVRGAIELGGAFYDQLVFPGDAVENLRSVEVNTRAAAIARILTPAFTPEGQRRVKPKPEGGDDALALSRILLEALRGGRHVFR